MAERSVNAPIGALRDLLRRAGERAGQPTPTVRELFELANRHGVAGYVLDELARSSDGGELPAFVRQELLARTLDYDAHLAALRALDRACADARLPAVALKGALLARRLYGEPALRATSDVDLLVGGARLDDAIAVLRTCGYVWEASPREEWYRREHHHLHLEHASSMPLELHFDAFSGFGSRLPGDELVAASAPADDFEALRILSPPDELVYLAAHAAAHRFERVGWTLDIALLARTMSDVELRTAHRRAEHWGFANALRFGLLRAAPLLDGSTRGTDARTHPRMLLANLLVVPPSGRWRSAASRVAYSLALCDNARTSAAFVAVTLKHHAE